LEKHSPLGLLLIVSDFFFKFKNFLFWCSEKKKE
jgi:hypothetical protein